MRPAAHILVVEDDHAIRETLAELLHDEGFVVRCASNGAEALEQLAADTGADVILLDLMMPVMDGWSFRQELRRDPRYAAIPVIVLSASSVSDPRTVGLGVDAFLAKPFAVSSLLDAVNRLCWRAAPAPP